MSVANPGSPPQLRGLMLAIFVSALPATLILPMMPAIGERLGVSGAALGLLFGIYPLTSVLAGPIWGRISDRIGRRPALLGTLAGAALAFLGFGLASSYVGLLLARAFQGLSGSARGIGFAVMSDTTSSEQRAAGIGAVSAAMALAFTLGPILGAAFMDEDPAPWARTIRVAFGAPAAGFDYLLPSLAGATLNLIAFAIIAFGFHETWRPPQRVDPRSQRTRGALTGLLNLTIVLLTLQFVLSGLIQGTLQFAFTLWANSILGWSAQQIALSLAALGLGFVISSGLFMRPLLRRMPAIQVVLLGVAIDLAGMTLFVALAQAWQWALAGLFVSALGGGFWATTIVGLVSKETPAEHQGLVMGLINGAGLIGRVAGPPLAGLATEAIGPRSPFFGILVCLVLILVLTLRLNRAPGRAVG